MGGRRTGCCGPGLRLRLVGGGELFLPPSLPPSGSGVPGGGCGEPGGSERGCVCGGCGGLRGRGRDVPALPAPPVPGLSASLLSAFQNKLVDRCERLQLQSAAIAKHVAEVLPARSQGVLVSPCLGAKPVPGLLGTQVLLCCHPTSC